MLSVLLIFQTLLAPISTLAAELPTVNEADQPTSAPATLPEANDGATIEDTTGDSSTSETTTPPVKDETSEPSQEQPEVKPTETPEAEATQGEENATPEEAEDKADEVQALNAPAQAKEITGVAFTHYKVSNTDVKEWAKTPVDAGKEYEFELGFSIPLTEQWADGSWFEFDLPATIVDYDGKFTGTVTHNGITLNYSTSGNKVRVTLSGMTVDHISTQPMPVGLEFTSKFATVGNSLQQDLTVPTPGGQEVITLTFKPGGNGEKLTKKAIGSPVLVDGNHQMEWEVWVNQNGDELNNATIVDTLSSNHELIGDITLEAFEVGLSGLGASKKSGTMSSWNDVNAQLTGNDAYKLTYKTEVTIAPEEREGAKSFNNNVTFTNNGLSTTKSATQSVTYEPFLTKQATKQEKYNSSWEIKYNFSNIPITASNNVLTDTMTGPHNIDTTSITVTKADGSAASGYAISDEGPKGFKVTFTEGSSDAYIIKYNAKYDNQAFFESKDGVAIDNRVNAGSKTNIGFGYSINENYLHKSYTVDFDKQQINWRIDIENDHPTEPMTVTLTDVLTGEHKFVTDSLVNESSNEFTKTYTIAPGTTETITYKTKFEVDNTGAVIGAPFANKADITWTDGTVTYEKEVTSTYTPDKVSQNNLYKVGKFDYNNQLFTWTILANVNKAPMDGATLTDVIGEGHELKGDINIYKAKLNASGAPTNDKDIVKDGVAIKTIPYAEASKQGFTINFDASYGQDAYIVEYQTKDTNDILGIEGAEGVVGDTYGNDVTFTIAGNTKTTDAKVKVDIANKILEKSSPQKGSGNEINWTLDVNKSHSKLGPATLKDTPSGYQMLDRGSLKIAKYDATSKMATATTFADAGATVTFNDDGSFEVKFANLTAGYKITYSTIGFPESATKTNVEVSNTATLDYQGGAANQQGSDHKAQNFSFSASSGWMSLTKGDLQIKKVGVDSLTGDTKVLPGITFDLIKVVGGKEYLLRQGLTTDAQGMLTIKDLSYADYVLKETSGTPAEYVKENYKVTLDADTDAKLDAAKVVTVVNKTKVDVNACSTFELQATDADGKPVTEITLTNKVTGVVITKTATGGKITLDRATDTPGNYEVTAKTQSGKTITFKDVKVTYDQCGTVVQIQQDKVCTTFKVTIKGDVVDAKGTTIDLEGKEVTVIEKATGTETKVTVTNKTFTMPKDAAIGEYAVKYGTQFLGNVTVSYVDCEAELTIAQTCPIFTVTLNNINGKAINGKEVVVKKDTTVVGNSTYTTDANGQITLNSLEPGEYTIYETDGTTVVGTFVTDDCQAVIQPKVADKCPKFEIKVDDPNNVLKTPISKLVLKEQGTGNNTYEVSKDKDGKFIFDTTTTTVPAGTYNVYDGNLFLGTVEVDYEVGCEATLTLTQAPTCPEFTLTVKDVNGNPRDNVTVTLTDEAGALVEVNGDTNFTTDVNGQIKIDNSVIKAGKYVVKEGSNVLGEVTVGNTCEAVVKPQSTTPPITVCEHYTIKVTGLGDNENTPRPGAEVVLKDKAGTTVVTGTTDKDGKVVFPREDLQVGEYTLYVDGAHIKVITVTIFDCQINVVAKQPAPSCPQVTVTLKDENGKARPNVDVTIKDSEGKTVATGTTDKDGKVTTEQPLTPGKYVVYEGDKKVGEFTKDATNCEYEITTTPAPSCPQVTITVTDKDGKARKDVDITIKDAKDKVVLTGFTNDEGKLTTGKPLPKGKYIVYEVDKKVGEFVVDGTNCEFDVTTTEKPEEPNCDKPEPGQPTDPDCEEEPNKPGEGGENPVDPNNPGEGGENPVDPNNPGTDGGKPVDPNNPNQGGGDGGKPVDPNNPNQNGSDNGKPVNPNKPGTDHNTTNDGKNPNKLPQTDGASNTIFVYIGLVLMAISAFIFFRRKATAK